MHANRLLRAACSSIGFVCRQHDLWGLRAAGIVALTSRNFRAAAEKSARDRVGPTGPGLFKLLVHTFSSLSRSCRVAMIEGSTFASSSTCSQNSSVHPTFVSELCGKGEGVQGVLTLFCGGVAQTCHDDRVVEIKEQLGIEEEGRRRAGRTSKGRRGEIESKRTRHEYDRG